MTSLVMQLTSDTSLRGTVKKDGTQVFAVYDFISLACSKKDNGAYARKTYSNLIKEGCEFKDELEKMVHYCQFPGAGQRETPTMTIRGLQRLLMILGGKVAASFRKEVEGTFTRVTAGDTTLIQEIRNNAASTAPMQLAFRQALVQEPIDNDDMSAKKRKAESEESKLFHMELQERRKKIEGLDQSNKEKALSNTQTMINILNTLNPHTGIDERTKLQIEDLTKNIMLPPGEVLGQAPLLLTDGQSHQPISIQVPLLTVIIL